MKTRKICLCVTLLCVLACLFAACLEGEHKCVFDREVAEEKYLAFAANCTSGALYYKSCECGEKDTETFVSGQPLGHTEEVLSVKAATCTETGLTEGIKCSVCGEILTAQEEIPVRHTEEVVPGKAATCTETGLAEGKKCSACGEVLIVQEEIPARHAEEVVPGKAATCTETGLTEGKKCSVCNTILTEQETIPTTGHDDVNGKCTRCGAGDPDDNHETMVWIPTKGGTKYHTRAGCSNMEDPKQVTQSEAESLGFTPCKRCH